MLSSETRQNSVDSWRSLGSLEYRSPICERVGGDNEGWGEEKVQD